MRWFLRRARWEALDIVLKLRMVRFYWPSVGPWFREVWQRDPSDQMCCSGHECGCYGSTYGDMWESLLRNSGEAA